MDPTTHRNEVRLRIGVVFQDPSLDQDLTAWENMEIHGVLYGVPRRERRERSEKLLALFALAERRGSLVKTFSGGAGGWRSRAACCTRRECSSSTSRRSVSIRRVATRCGR